MNIIIVFLFLHTSAQDTVRSTRCPTETWQILLDPGKHCYKLLNGHFTFTNAFDACKREHALAKPVLPRNDRENELVVNMMGEENGAWISALRQNSYIVDYFDKRSGNDGQLKKRLPFNRVSSKVRKIMYRKPQRYGTYVFIRKNAEWLFFKKNSESRVKRAVICQVPARHCNKAAKIPSERTLSGYDCQRWDSNTPHVPKVKMANSSLYENFCQPIEDQVPWCYTTNPLKKWEYCPNDRCAEDDYEAEEDKMAYNIIGSEKFCGKKFCASYRVIGGVESQPCQHPWLVQLIYSKEQTFADNSKGHHACGGALIGSCWVLTAAHCILSNGKHKRLNEIIRTNEFKVRVGRRLKEGEEEGDQILGIKNIRVHDEFEVNSKTGAADNDIALLQLEPNRYGICAEFNERVRPICLPRRVDLFKVSNRCFISGWGYDSASAHNFSEKVQSATLNINRFKVCRKNYREDHSHESGNTRPVRLIHQQHICASIPGVVDACIGDSGGPLECIDRKTSQHTLAGLVSFGKTCASERFPGVYTNVPYYGGWIRSSIIDIHKSPPRKHNHKQGRTNQ